MVRLTLVRSILVVAGSRMPRLLASAKATNANSPPWLSISPVLSEAAPLSPNALLSSGSIDAFRPSIPTTIATRRGGCWR